MSNTNKKNNTKRKPRKKFLDVDVFRNTFGPVSEKAVYDVFQTIFKVEDHNMRKYTFPHCVQQLRKYKLQQQEKENK
tara:strand:+ start:3140 stop:3370 length:231 start_codon:yes stop_codon:yes gene_type:complete